MGLIFTYNIDEEPKVCYSSQFVSSHVVFTSMAVTILMAFSNGILLDCDSHEVKHMIDNVCSIGINSDDALMRMSRGVSNAIITGFHSVRIIRDVSSLLPIMQTDRKAGFEMNTETNDQLTQFEKKCQETSITWLNRLEIMTQEISKLASSKKDEISLDMVESSVIQSIMFDLQGEIELTLSSIHSTLSSWYNSRVDLFPQSKPESMEALLSHLKKTHMDSKTNPLMRFMIEADFYPYMANVTLSYWMLTINRFSEFHLLRRTVKHVNFYTVHHILRIQVVS